MKRVDVPHEERERERVVYAQEVISIVCYNGGAKGKGL